MLLDILGVLIGFASIMLIFSLLVTILCQCIQGMLNKRYAVLKTYLQLFATCVQRELPESAPALGRAIDELLDDTTLNGQFIKRLSYVSQNELSKRLVAAWPAAQPQPQSPPSPDATLALLEVLFPKLEAVMTQVFKQWMSRLAFGVALVLAFGVHLSAFDVLRGGAELSHYTSVAGPGLGGEAPTPRATAHQFFDFAMLPQNCQCYFSVNYPWRSVTNFVGILISAVFMSLGAPFWFGALQHLFRLRAP